ISYINGGFNVTKKGLTITASSPANITYGDAIPTVTAGYSGFISGDNASSLTTPPTCGTNYTVGAGVGAYTTSCSGAASSNYQISYINGGFSVIAKALTITASSPADITYGD